MLRTLTLDAVALFALRAVELSFVFHGDDDWTAGRRAPVDRLILLHCHVQRPLVVLIEHLLRQQLLDVLHLRMYVA